MEDASDLTQKSKLEDDPHHTQYQQLPWQRQPELKREETSLG